jgi:four helix bundle protein
MNEWTKRNEGIRMTNDEIRRTKSEWRSTPIDPAPKKPTPERIYDLEERTAKFGEAVVDFAKKIPPTPVNSRLITQLVGCGTSIGANYCEADDAVSRKDFMNRIGTCRKESRETKFFRRMVAAAEPSLAVQCRELWQEAHELNRIFASIFRQR